MILVKARAAQQNKNYIILVVIDLEIHYGHCSILTIFELDCESLWVNESLEFSERMTEFLSH